MSATPPGPVPGPTGPSLPVPDGLVEAFWAYERALMADDVETLDRLVARASTTLRGDAAGLLVGHDQVSAFRRSHGPAPRRRIVQTHVQVTDPDHALVVAVTELERGGRGQQTQLWARGVDGWVVTAAHVSAPAPALDSRIWRVVGDPLVPGAAGGPLAGESLAVKDLYAVAGQVVGAGNPAWEAAAPVERGDARVVDLLVEAGASVRGIARTDEFAYSLAGTNHHFGSPPNPRAPYRVSGGSSSGSASAVSLGHATIGLGTDTGGSIRVPAAYQGLYGIRTTHAAIATHGLLALAPSFDTVGWMTRDADLLALVGEVLLPDSPGGSTDLVVVPELLGWPRRRCAPRWRAGSATRDWSCGRAGRSGSSTPGAAPSPPGRPGRPGRCAGRGWPSGSTPSGPTCAAASPPPRRSRARRPTQPRRSSPAPAPGCASSSATGCSCCPPRPRSPR